MSAIPEDIPRPDRCLSPEVLGPYPGSRKAYEQGSRPDLRVPYRELLQGPTPSEAGPLDNPPIPLYDTSGPYSDPEVS